MPQYDANKAINDQDPSLLGLVRFKIVTGELFRNDTIAEFKSIWGDEIDEIPRVCDADVSSHVALVSHNENLNLKAIACCLLCKIFIVYCEAFLVDEKDARVDLGAWSFGYRADHPHACAESACCTYCERNVVSEGVKEPRRLLSTASDAGTEYYSRPRQPRARRGP
ncbi:hypothetical protein CMUS01_15690 [Colletotrichum musicola]|uniref:Uncharacterized protein n=1 Tax=Colletotrichum musicola TaxID=2175873 RepID=A0A8H6IVA6_9PEZI|nr:hypothetical protein CMUS01_15690 [Colletotrichum musicola]